ncbi:Lim and transglutaminase domain protein [Aphelenchoides besseyi]|nr:Lim and transglutaminase domain protein [Aphelenchoides besseyi]
MAPLFHTMVKETCHRCAKAVYPTDKVGPLKDSSYFHHGCFKCYICGTRLAIKTYCNNRDDIDDREVYCANHVPNANPHDPIPNRTSKLNGKSTPTAQNDLRWADAGMQDMKIAHAMKATQVTKPYPKIKHEGAKYAVDYDAQTRLELIHRRVEDDLYRTFNEERRRELEQFQEETKEEWEKALADFARRYERGSANTDQKEDLVRQLTIKRDRKLETLTHRRKERERHKTTELFDRQAVEMLDLFRQARQTKQEDRNGDYEESYSASAPSYPSTPPPPQPAVCSKRNIYTDTAVFEHIDQVAISIAQSDVSTFTDLVRTLISGARSDVEKARAIYRWITVKNLNVMVFDNDLENDSPMGLLRGIKYGTESYHVLFKRLCSYAGLHCVVIKGYSKSAGYQPGMKFLDTKFRNTWNAVYVDGNWRFVQCNWGARHLVNAKDGPRQSSPQQQENNLRYSYDDHYFLTPSEEFIYEFFPNEPAWQLLERPISLEQFERLPFVRSLFFRYGLRFTNPRLESVIHADENGAANISIGIDRESSNNLIFHYNLRFYDSEETEVEGLSLKRFVMQSSLNNSVLFRVHVPTTRPLLLDVFANAVSTEHYLTGQPIKFKSVCKFKIVCDYADYVMVPLPSCASGEWGPRKAYRLFNLLPCTHEDAIINCGQYCEIRFKMLKPLAEFVANLHRNGLVLIKENKSEFVSGVDDRHLQRCVQTNVRGDDVIINLELPDEGQYGLDIYTREAIPTLINGKQLLTHCCKYLLNARVE